MCHIFLAYLEESLGVFQIVIAVWQTYAAYGNSKLMSIRIAAISANGKTDRARRSVYARAAKGGNQLRLRVYLCKPRQAGQ